MSIYNIQSMMLSFSFMLSIWTPIPNDILSGH